ncbi:Conserved protein containing a Zn-ribbon-like motif, possibly RNA-binding [Nakamurella panacisegetis]|uniref:Conserved protein containing a Zn-ribbon-like motif, possibly RNA-binding n=2 Tax=Nakamurella panacisegetis TaxID=1090615 RepID=A0A1H0QRG4_9ACTN|nr:Conserved protein containing a Zn-ribbon-like motif, possibly RNA-binding [Nakamurella panacisegetis]
MTPAVAKRFRSGRACLDFAHTAETPDWREPELVYDRPSLERWLSHILGLAAVRTEPGDVAEAHRLRAAILRLARARTSEQPFDPQDVDVLNAFAAAAPPIPRLTANGALAPLAATAVAGLSAIARDAIDLFAGPLGHRIRVCASPDCAYMFVDASRPGTRRWCSMQRCGNLAKVHTHRDNQAVKDLAR